MHDLMKLVESSFFNFALSWLMIHPLTWIIRYAYAHTDVVSIREHVLERVLQLEAEKSQLTTDKHAAEQGLVELRKEIHGVKQQKADIEIEKTGEKRWYTIKIT